MTAKDPKLPVGPSRGFPGALGPTREEVSRLAAEIQEEAARRAREAAARRKERKRPVIRWLLLAIVLLGNAYLWLGPGAWWRSGLEPEEALRFRMFLQAQRIEAFQRSYGALPGNLQEVGDPLPGLEYRVTPEAGWELVGESGGRRLVLRSDEPLEQFLTPGEP